MNVQILSVCLSVYVCTCLSVCLCTCLSVFLSVFLSASVSVRNFHVHLNYLMNDFWPCNWVEFTEQYTLQLFVLVHDVSFYSIAFQQRKKYTQKTAIVASGKSDVDRHVRFDVGTQSFPVQFATARNRETLKNLVATKSGRFVRKRGKLVGECLKR